MGYITNFYGDIEIKDEFALFILKEINNKKICPIIEIKLDSAVYREDKYDLKVFDCLDIDITGNTLSISGDWKSYYDEIKILCQFIAELDKKASGIVECEGEEKDDIWRVEIKEGKAIVFNTEVIYNYEENFKEEKVSRLTETLKNDKNLKVLMLANKIKGENETSNTYRIR